jgi:hypothetical protein
MPNDWDEYPPEDDHLHERLGPPPGFEPFNHGGDDSSRTLDRTDAIINAVSALVDGLTNSPITVSVWTNKDETTEPVKVMSGVLPGDMLAIVLKPSNADQDKIITALANGHVLVITADRGLVQ